jgi:predicted enzyme related to lactoylglutathione lyase
MIFGAHFLLYSKEAEADRAFLRDVLGWSSVDAGGDWPIFALPPSEIAVHPAQGKPAKTEDEHAGAALYLMCDDLKATMKNLESRKVSFSKVEDAPWGIVTSFELPSGARVGLYQAKHKTAFKR